MDQKRIILISALTSIATVVVCLITFLLIGFLLSYRIGNYSYVQEITQSCLENPNSDACKSCNQGPKAAISNDIELDTPNLYKAEGEDADLCNFCEFEYYKSAMFEEYSKDSIDRFCK